MQVKEDFPVVASHTDEPNVRKFKNSLKIFRMFNSRIIKMNNIRPLSRPGTPYFLLLYFFRYTPLADYPIDAKSPTYVTNNIKKAAQQASKELPKSPVLKSHPPTNGQHYQPPPRPYQMRYAYEEPLRRESIQPYQSGEDSKSSRIYQNVPKPYHGYEETRKPEHHRGEHGNGYAATAARPNTLPTKEHVRYKVLYNC